MKFDLSKVEKSKSDIKRGITLPTFLSEELAEFIGVIIGDGHLRSSYKRNSKGRLSFKADIIISGNKKEEAYLRDMMRLFYLLFNLKMKYTIDNRSNGVLLQAHSKGIVQYLHKICEIPLNRKTTIVCIPNIIKKSNKNIKTAFLRGLADTDFAVTFKNRCNKGHNYPVIKGGFKSEILIRDLESVYSELGFKYCVCYNERGFDKRKKEYNLINCIYLNGRENFSKWINLIGFSNNKFNRKVEKWLKDGVCPPGY